MFQHCYTGDENEENNTTNPVNKPPSTQSSRVVHIVYTICICVHSSAETGFKKEVYLQSLKRPGDFLKKVPTATVPSVIDR